MPTIQHELHTGDKQLNATHILETMNAPQMPTKQTQFSWLECIVL